MKKNRNNRFVMLALLLASLTGAVQAQRPVGDTLTSVYDDPTYYLDAYGWSMTPESSVWYTEKEYFILSSYGLIPGNCSGPPFGCMQPLNNVIRGSQMQTDRPLKILGIAACAFIGPVWGNRTTPANTLDTTMAGRITDSLKLYKLTPRGPAEIASGPWRMENPHRNIVLPPYLPLRYCPLKPGSGLPIPVASLYEVMFDKPQVVVDSFVVAGTEKNNSAVRVTDDFGNGKCYWHHPPTYYYVLCSWDTVPDTVRVNWIWTEYYGEWVRSPNSLFMRTIDFGWPREMCLIYPIIDPDFDTVLCDVVRDVRMVDSTDTTMTLMWNGGNNVEWEVQYMEVNGWDLWTTTTTVPMVTLTGLRERTNYNVRVRGKCSWDTEFGEWSEWLDLFTGAHRNDPPQSVSNLERFTQMMPNPSRGMVTVLSSYRLSRVVVYDLQGQAVLEQEDDGLATTFDVSGLAKGVYVVAIHTPAGIATKRLVVGE